ncbi:hypothetical protein CEXT_291841 [Caerostris extrusa]|uniref:Uncharacterized protein n=1 Tax=Caerostris extrusa TaxID=172846 RepID=A0AAV4YEZ5_CAEEX|nr:hypothetical protein CEXT_291841 [Caerostris extrusa]
MISLQTILALSSRHFRKENSEGQRRFFCGRKGHSLPFEVETREESYANEADDQRFNDRAEEFDEERSRTETFLRWTNSYLEISKNAFNIEKTDPQRI